MTKEATTRCLLPDGSLLMAAAKIPCDLISRSSFLLLTVTVVFVPVPSLIQTRRIGQGGGFREDTPVRRGGIRVGLPGETKRHLHVFRSKGKVLACRSVAGRLLSLTALVAWPNWYRLVPRTWACLPACVSHEAVIGYRTWIY